jgi:hypothetical protein
MKLSTKAMLAIATAIPFFLFSGCTKEFDYLRGHPGQPEPFCQIEKITVQEMGETFDVNFNYNAAGQLTDVVPPYDPRVLPVHFHFYYDAHNRMSGYDEFEEQVQNIPSPLNSHRYIYANKKTIIDSAYILDIVTPYSISTYTLDNWGRIIRDSTAYYNFGYPPPPPDIFNYTYDAHGNLIRPGVTYDNKVNIYRTNAVWMLVYQNYSANNPLTDSFATYNSYGLPVSIVNPGAKVGGALFDYIFNNMNVKYSCDCDPDQKQTPPTKF